MITKELVLTFQGLNNKEELFENLANKYVELGLVKSKDEVVEGLKRREAESTTGFEKGIAIPHTQADVTKAIISVSRINPITWPALDGNTTDLVINIVVPKNQGSEHLKILSKLSAKLMDDDFVTKLKAANEEEVVSLINSINEEKKVDKQAVTENQDLYLAVTGCPTGIAHTYMAAENIEKTGHALGYAMKVETRGQSGVDNELTEADIAKAKGIIVAADVKVPTNRFAGKKVIQVPVKRGLKDVEDLFTEVDNAAEFQGNSEEQAEEDNEKFSAYKSLMNGVTHMLPFVVVGGILTAMRFLFGTPDDIAAGVEPLIHIEELGIFFGNIGGILFAMMLPILGAYIAMSIGNRPGLMLGFLAGMMASTDGSGFLGAILGGFVAGFIAKYLTNASKKLPKSLQGSAAILFAPLCGAILLGLFMTIFGVPVSMLNNGLINGLQALEDFNPILLGAVVGAMMAVDMGGPVNKAAYVTGTLLLAEGNQTFMAAVMAGGMVPPLAIAIATTINGKLFTEEEREAGKTNYVMGLSFVTEGAIPFAAKNPKKVIPALMAGSAVGGALTMLFGITLPAPHGGIFVLPLVNSPLLYLIAIIVGSIIGALILNINLKRR